MVKLKKDKKGKVKKFSTWDLFHFCNLGYDYGMF